MLHLPRSLKRKNKIMASLSSLRLLGFVALTLFLFFLAYVPHQAQALDLGSTVRKIVRGNLPIDGLCASSITNHGYKCQELEVTTKDGYIINLQRIPEGRAAVGGDKRKKQPVIIQHGIMMDGMSWLLNSPEQNLPMILADIGFDVWIVNSRGTRYSRKHTSMDASNAAYWNWSWDEMVANDMPAIFDYVSRETGQKIDYIGHSLGTLIALASFSEGKLVNQLKSAALLSPVAYLSHMKSPLLNVAAKSYVGEMITFVGMEEFDPKGSGALKFVESLCLEPEVNCSDLLTAITGDNCCVNRSTINLFLNSEPQPTSTKTFVHLSQIVRGGVVAKFEDGDISPPIYNLSNIPHDLPLFMSYGGKDALSDVDDVRTLLDHLKFHDVDKLNVQYIDDYAHADFICAYNAKDIVYNAVTSFFNHHV